MFTTNFPGSAGNGDSPEYKSVQGVGSGNNVTWPTTRCTVKFNLPVTMKRPVFVYYRLTDFHQNHRRYIKSMDENQLSGVYRSAADLKGSACDPLSTVTENGIQYPIYPCGLIANSMFNDSFSLFMMPFDNTTNNNRPYILTDTNITWKSDAAKYGHQPYTDLSKVRPPPNWRNFPNGYSALSPPIDITKDEHFQIWMRASGLPNFRKMYSKNDVTDLPNGTYTIDIDMNYNVSSYGGTKSIVISTVSFLGSRNPFLGIAYVVVGVLCVVLGLLFTARHMYKPRRLGDHTYLSWNQNAERSDFASATATGASARY
ncbi:CDC50/LEM3 family [Dissophora ornata]|nr:CDC50/LEM3 family [Dissophora ornata]